MSIPNVYDIGDIVQLSGAFSRTSDGSPIDPDVVTLYLKDPTGAVTSYTTSSGLQHPGTGSFFLNYSPLLDGKFWYRFTSTGAGQASAEQDFDVRVRRTQ